MQGLVSQRLLGAAAAGALACCVVASLALGVRPGVTHIAAVACGWAYDLGLKSTLASPLPYAVAFGLLPAVSTLAAPIPAWPLPGVLVGAGLLGMAAHFANTVGDAADDAATGVRGLPQRLGPVTSLRISAVLVALAAAALLTAVRGGGAVPFVLLASGAVVAGDRCAARRPDGAPRPDRLPAHPRRGGARRRGVPAHRLTPSSRGARRWVVPAG